MKIIAKKVFYYFFRPYGQMDDHMMQLRPKLANKYFIYKFAKTKPDQNLMITTEDIANKIYLMDGRMVM